VAETILIVDDEELVRRTFREWLQDAGADCELLEAWDAESALRIASQRPIDLAILDWNLGAGNNGLQLLEDLRVFSPEVVAILVTGYAQQATPLDALRMGVRDYLDKSRDLRRETLLAVVRRQLEQIRPAKRERQHLERVRRFREAVEAVLPMVQTASQLASGIAPSESLRALLCLAQDIFQSRQGVLLVRHGDTMAGQTAHEGKGTAAQGEAERSGNYERAGPALPAMEVFDLEGRKLSDALGSFADTVAATALAMQEVCAIGNLKEEARCRHVSLQAYEAEHENALLVPVPLEPPRSALLEIFDTPLASRNLSAEERDCLRHFQQLARAVLEQLFAERQLHTALWRALSSALQRATEAASSRASVTLPKEDWSQMQEAIRPADLLPDQPRELLELAWRLGELLRRYGLPAVQFCRQLLDQLEQLLRQLVDWPNDFR